MDVVLLDGPLLTAAGRLDMWGFKGLLFDLREAPSPLPARRLTTSTATSQPEETLPGIDAAKDGALAATSTVRCNGWMAWVSVAFLS